MNKKLQQGQMLKRYGLEKKCLNCGKTFKQTTKQEKKFCNRDCSRNYLKKQKVEKNG